MSMEHKKNKTTQLQLVEMMGELPQMKPWVPLGKHEFKGLKHLSGSEKSAFNMWASCSIHSSLKCSYFLMLHQVM